MGSAPAWLTGLMLTVCQVIYDRSGRAHPLTLVGRCSMKIDLREVDWSGLLAKSAGTFRQVVVSAFTVAVMFGAYLWWAGNLPFPPSPDPIPPSPIVLDDVYVAESGVGKVLKAKTNADWVDWIVVSKPEKARDPQLIPTDCPCSVVFIARDKGRYKICAEIIHEGEILRAFSWVTVDVGPDPPEPGPGPGPEPEPEPEPTPPEPAPIPAKGLHVLVVYESMEGKPSGEATQWYALNSQDVLSYLNEHASGNWHVWDKDVPTKDMPELWQNALKRAKEKQNKLPWVIVSNGETGWEGPLPMTKQEIKDLLQRYTPTK